MPKVNLLTIQTQLLEDALQLFQKTKADGDDIEDIVQKILTTWELHELSAKFRTLSRGLAIMAACTMVHSKKSIAIQDHRSNMKLMHKCRKAVNHIVPFMVHGKVHFLDICFWIQARCFMIDTPNTRHFQKWKSFLDKHNITLQSYTRSFVNTKTGVYIMIAFNREHSYIGATADTVTGRYRTRLRKLRQIQNGRFVECEVAIRFWINTKSFHDYFPIFVIATDTKETALVTESVQQHHMQPSLCMPWIAEHFKGQSKTPLKHTRVQGRFFQRFRYSIKDNRDKNQDKDLHQKNWQKLHHLGGKHKTRFLTARNLRKKSTHPLSLYYLHRLSKHLDQPFQARAQSQLKKLFDHHGLKQPDMPKPFLVPFLANAAYKRDLRQVLKQFIQDNSKMWTPLFWPSSTIMEGSNKTIADIIHNWRPAMKQWTTSPPTSCNCKELLQKYDDLPHTEGHIAGGFNSSKLPKNLQYLATACTKDGVFLPKEKYISILKKAFKKWLPASTSSCFPDDFIASIIDPFIETHWPSHLQSCESHKFFQSKDISCIHSLFPECIFHNEDHQPHKLCIYCPILYYQLLRKTFADQAVFDTIPVAATLLQHSIPDMVPKSLKRKYPWGFNEDSALAYGYILPKSKKQFTTARPIIASKKSFCCQLFRAAAIIICQIMELVYAKTFGNRKMKQILKDLSDYINKFGGPGGNIIFDNSDLKGFFTSVPHEEVLSAIKHLSLQYFELPTQKAAFKDICFTVQNRFTSKTRIIRGKSFTKTTKNRVIYLADLESITALALSMSHFECMGLVHIQSRGAIMGGHASPILCAVAVAYDEFIWMNAYKITLDSSFICVRYVDNRLTMVNTKLAEHSAYRMFLDKMFYQFPVELEDCGNQEFLGYVINIEEKCISFKVPQEAHAYRSCRSAGTMDKVLSGLTARLHLLYRGTFPRSNAKALIQELLGHYEQKGFPRFVLSRIAFKVSARYL